MIRPVFVCGVPLSDLFSMGRPILSLIRLQLFPTPFPVTLLGLRHAGSMRFPVALVGLRHAGSTPFPVALVSLPQAGSMGLPILSLIRLALFPMPFPVALLGLRHAGSMRFPVALVGLRTLDSMGFSVPFFVGGHFLWVLGPVPGAFGHVP